LRDKRIYQHLSSLLPELTEDYFRVADDPGISAKSLFLTPLANGYLRQ
jgi:hypothetical protein